MLNKIESILSMPDNEKPHGRDDADARGHIGFDLLYEYLTGYVTEAEKLSVQGHLNSCARCYQEMKSLVQDLQTIPNAQELELLQAMPIPKPEDQVARLLAWSHAPLGPSPARMVQSSAIRHRWQQVKEAILDWGRFQPVFYVRTAIVVTAILALLLIGGTQFPYWQSRFLTQRGIDQLTQAYSIDSRTVPRPSGGFIYTELTRTLGDVGKPDLSPIQRTLNRALNRKNPQASQYLATYYLLIEQDLNRANQYYQQAVAKNPSNARVLNDLGLLAWHEADLARALSQFQHALAIEPNFQEAQYNIALAHEQLGHIPDAVAAWQSYLLLDKNSDWARIAQDHLNELKGSSEY